MTDETFDVAIIGAGTAIDRSLTVHDLMRMPINHPVLEEGMRTALRQIAAQVPQCSDCDLAACAAIGATALD